MRFVADRLKTTVRSLIIVAVATLALGNANQVWAQAGIVVENAGAAIQFGQQVIFHATIKSQIPIQTVSILILDSAGNLIHTGQVNLQPDGATQFNLDARQTSLRPFTTLRWRYELILADGNTVQSQSFSIRYDDNRAAWQQSESGALRLFWIQGDAAFAQSALHAAQNGLSAINEFFPADLSQPVDIFIYPSQNDLQSLGAESWVAGFANPESSAVLVTIESGANQNDQLVGRIPHELMHVMLYRHLGAGYNNLPAWLREGMATLVEMNPHADYENALVNASSHNTLIPLLDLCASFPPQPDSAFLAYAESWSFTAYLRGAFGDSKLLDLARAYADGATCERGVEMVYGSSLAQMELNWRQSSFGQNALRAALGNMLPYLILCGIVLGIPMMTGLIAARKKKK